MFMFPVRQTRQHDEVNNASARYRTGSAPALMAAKDLSICTVGE